MKNNKSINDITLFRYLFNLDNRNLPQSILNWYNNIGSVVDSNRESAIRELSRIKGNCRNLVIFSKTFIDTMDKSYMKFTQFHMDILNELDNENGIVRSPYFLEGCYVVYSIKNGCLTLWIFQDKIDKYLSIPTYYICVSPKDKIKGEGHQLDCMILPLLDNCMEANLRDYIDMVLDYLCLRQWAEVQLGKVSSTVKKEIKKNKKTQVITPTQLGEMIYEVVNASIRALLNPELTASWEKGLNYVAEGSITSREYMDKLEHFIRVKVGGVLQVNYQAALRSRYDSIAGNYRKGGK